MILRAWPRRRSGRSWRSDPGLGRSSRAGPPTGGYWQVGADRAEEFIARDYKLRHFFPHRVYWLPKCGPDGFRLADWMCRIDDPCAMWELVLYADPELLGAFPPELFFDDELVWHQQQFGMPGQIATASIVLDRRRVRVLTLTSDLVQRISRRRDQKTRVEKTFKGWSHMLLNAVLHFALAQGASEVQLASSSLAFRHTDRSREVDRTIFEHIYDDPVSSLFSPRRRGGWWSVRLDDLRHRIVIPERRQHQARNSKTICIFHDVERSLGHADVDPSLARSIGETSERALQTMLEIEAEMDVGATYNVVGSLMPEVRPRIQAHGHCVAFHSFDHCTGREDQLERCRKVDYRVKGYRPPRSALTPELTERNLLFHNFEWIANATESLDVVRPELRNGLVRIPIELDDFPLHTGAMRWEQWEDRAMRLIEENYFTAIGLHDCYGPLWLPHYSRFLARISEEGELLTMDDVAAEVTLRSAA